MIEWRENTHAHSACRHAAVREGTAARSTASALGICYFRNAERKIPSVRRSRRTRINTFNPWFNHIGDWAVVSSVEPAPARPSPRQRVSTANPFGKVGSLVRSKSWPSISLFCHELVRSTHTHTTRPTRAVSCSHRAPAPRSAHAACAHAPRIRSVPPSSAVRSRVSDRRTSPLPIA